MSLIKEFYNDVTGLLDKIKKSKEDYWVKRGEKQALRLFHEMYARVPAYKDFLQKNGVRADKISDIKDFDYIPATDKDNYLKQYDYSELCWDGNFEKQQWKYASTSGSTGEPFYFPRTSYQDEQYALLAEMYLRDNFKIQERTTLYVNCFGLGVWIGGIFTHDAISRVAEKGNYSLSIISPGTNMAEAIKTIRQLGIHYDQVIIGGYPPLVKDLIDEGINANLDWKKFNIGIIFSAEGFPESFRKYVITKAGIKNYYTGTLDHYGTVDLGTMAHETPLCVFLRQKNMGNLNLLNHFLPSKNRQPTVAQYIPELFFFEEKEGSLFCSADSGLPLVKYDLKDVGGIFSFDELIKNAGADNFDLHQEWKKAGIENTIWQVPFVYVYERQDFTVSLYGANVYPDSIRRVLESDKFSSFVTGKTTLVINFDNKQNQYLEVNVELKKNIKGNDKLKNDLGKHIVDILVRENSEYRNSYEAVGKRAEPIIVLSNYQDEKFFKPGRKQKWVEHK
ncbi:hypothetical protein KJ641_01460 [Patescibacteria group bacterium]|nr:hypothetical protein [Patescibacteria group bacterium]